MVFLMLLRQHGANADCTNTNNPSIWFVLGCVKQHLDSVHMHKGRNALCGIRNITQTKSSQDSAHHVMHLMLAQR